MIVVADTSLSATVNGNLVDTYLWVRCDERGRPSARQETQEFLSILFVLCIRFSND
jgi:hypothetical protein